jgi:hypothetical protein
MNVIFVKKSGLTLKKNISKIILFTVVQFAISGWFLKKDFAAFKSAILVGS